MAKTLGVDVSTWNGTIDWAKFKQQGVKFAIIRAGFGSDASQEDTQFKRNITAAYKQGIAVGIYWFGYCHSVSNAKLEADACNTIISPYKDYITLPVFFDWEYDSYNYVTKNGLCTPTKKLVTDMTIAFMNRMQDYGYKAGYYTNIDYMTRFYDYDRIKSYNLWLAQWRVSAPDSSYDCVIHQYSENGQLQGNGSTYVDMNHLYSDEFSVGSTGGSIIEDFHPRLSTNDSFWGDMKKSGTAAYEYYHGSKCFDPIGSFSGGVGMPNCTAYAWGRFREIAEKYTGNLPSNVIRGNAKNWYADAPNRGYEVGKEPKLGAIICWSNSDAGHVAVVEQINSDGSIVTSESGYQLDYFWTRTRYNKTGHWDASSGYTLEGFIYVPGFDGSGSYIEREWVAKDNIDYSNPLTQEEKENNAILFARYFLDKEWSLQAIAAMLGNIAGEGAFNPGQWEYFTELYGTFPNELPVIDKNFDGYYDDGGGQLKEAGYGLVGWTPYTKYAHWVIKTYGKDAQWRRNGEYQCAFIQHEMESEQQYIYAYESSYGNYTELKTFKGFSQSTIDPYLLGRCFMLSYERPLYQSESDRDHRGKNATIWYKFLIDNQSELYSVSPPYVHSCEQYNAKTLIVSGNSGGKVDLTKSIKLYYAWDTTELDITKEDSYDGVITLEINKPFKLIIHKPRRAKQVTFKLVQINGGRYPEQVTSMTVVLTPSYPCVHIYNSNGEFVPYVPFVRDSNGINMYVPVIKLQDGYYAIYNTDIEKID